VKFVINYAVNVATGVAPFEILLIWWPTLFHASLPEGKPTALSKWIILREKFWADARDHLCASRIKQANQHNLRMIIRRAWAACGPDRHRLQQSQAGQAWSQTPKVTPNPNPFEAQEACGPQQKK
jgi:hypothetical protein